MSTRGHAAAALAGPPATRRLKVKLKTRADGVAWLNFRARVRRAALVARKINAGLLLLAVLALFAGETTGAMLAVLGLGAAAWGFERLADGPKTLRSQRIIADRRPVLKQKIVVIGETRRRGRIVRNRPSPIVLALPPSRPRSRALDRRAVMGGADFED
jgi:hypothetical protein